MADTYDVDAGAGNFRPITVKFRGQDYQLPASALALVRAATKGKTFVDPNAEPLEGMMAALPVVLRELNPAWPADPPLTDGELLALMAPVTEVLNRIRGLTFQAETAGQ
ncbi:MAG: hypothetical protein L0Y64_02575 [Myxococcaceae bacterium]|nr:hypothetical protein [Myxococcaceae bacterium]